MSGLSGFKHVTIVEIPTMGNNITRANLESGTQHCCLRDIGVFTC